MNEYNCHTLFPLVIFNDVAIMAKWSSTFAAVNTGYGAFGGSSGATLEPVEGMPFHPYAVSSNPDRIPDLTERMIQGKNARENMAGLKMYPRNRDLEEFREFSEYMGNHGLPPTKETMEKFKEEKKRKELEQRWKNPQIMRTLNTRTLGNF